MSRLGSSNSDFDTFQQAASIEKDDIDEQEIPAVDAFATRRKPGASSFFNALLATALFRCWHILIFFSAWATAITLINKHVHSVTLQPTLLTVVGTVLGFVVSYRTTSSFERYNEGRRLWSQIILASRTFARTTWFHVNDIYPDVPGHLATELPLRSLVEKKTIINLLEAFAVSVKHYLRGEDGIYYEDLYHLVKFLPAYALPPGIPTALEATNNQQFDSNGQQINEPVHSPHNELTHRHPSTNPDGIPMPATTPRLPKTSFAGPASPVRPQPHAGLFRTQTRQTNKSETDGDVYLFPSRMPPKSHLLDLFPFSLVVKIMTKRGHGLNLKGKKAARMRAKLRNADSVSHNLPLEISLYLSSYISALQRRKAADVPTTNTLLAGLNQLVDALTGLERILTTPIPFSYSIHLWVVAIIYSLMLPFQIYSAFGYLTIPATAIISFIFFGFLVAGEEIENPFGYDKNDLNLDHFTHNIIRNELRAITASAGPDPHEWVFSIDNDLVFAPGIKSDTGEKVERVSPTEWVKRGEESMRDALLI